MERFRRKPADNPTGVPVDETADLVRRAQAGQRPALNTLFGRFRPTVVNLARRRIGGRLRSKEDPEDLAQTTIREAARDLSGYEYRGKRSFLNWLSRILQNKIRDKAEYYSAAKRDSSREGGFTLARHDGDDLAFEPPSLAPSTTRIVERDEEFEALHEHLERLSPLHRDAIRLVYFEGLTLREAGLRMGGRSEDAVRMIVRRAAERLRTALENQNRGHN
jgi:RNA polymerase sigma-70 factor (subfamily 1)